MDGYMTTEKEYQATLDYLYSFVDYSLTHNLNKTSFVDTLDDMLALDEEAGRPHQAYPCVHIAGTKGKGSTGALIAAALQAAGYKVGFYTSPHLEDFCERIQINRENISHSRFVGLIDSLKPAIESVGHVSTFDIATEAAFLYFAQEKVDVAIIEVGLGGRLDSTNVITPAVAVITSLSMDHMAVLGNSLEKIAAEKGGIIKENRPVVASPQKPEAMLVIKEIAAKRNAELFDSDVLYPSQILEHTLAHQLIDVSIQGQPSLRLDLPLLGDHQRENAITAFTALQVLKRSGFIISDEAIQQGFHTVNWRGRFDILNRSPLVISDSAHNLDSALKLKQTLADYLPEAHFVLVFGASEDKDISGMFAQLLPLMDEVIFTQSIHPRSCKAEKLLELAAEYPCKKAIAVPLEAAMIKSLHAAGKEKVVLVTGSIFVAAGAQLFFENKLVTETVR
jgi:dihydrofolate synthase/folylpolyglutamate synthase